MESWSIPDVTCVEAGGDFQKKSKSKKRNHQRFVSSLDFAAPKQWNNKTTPFSSSTTQPFRLPYTFLRPCLGRPNSFLFIILLRVRRRPTNRPTFNLHRPTTHTLRSSTKHKHYMRLFGHNQSDGTHVHWCLAKLFTWTFGKPWERPATSTSNTWPYREIIGWIWRSV